MGKLGTSLFLIFSKILIFRWFYRKDAKARGCAISWRLLAPFRPGGKAKISTRNRFCYTKPACPRMLKIEPAGHPIHIHDLACKIQPR